MSGYRPRFSGRSAVSASALAAAILFGVTGAVSYAAATAAGPSGRAADPPASTRPQNLVVSTDKGQVEGRTTGVVDQFLGIPYAQPPVGDLRWAAPAPMPVWSGVRAALSYGNRCPQQANGNGPRIDTEDCLYLNVFAPSVIPAGSGLPVLFMIHGGGLTTGAGDQQDGSLFAQAEHAVVVSINYRLGAFGYLALPGLDAQNPNGDFGLLDQEAALRWTHANIAAFGGDPARVTIAGESAGGWSVCGLLASPPVRGLFSGAIMESGSCLSEPTATAQANAVAYAAKAGCAAAATAAACLRTKPESALLDAAGAYQQELVPGGPELPVAPAQAIASGRYAKVPVLFGVNHDEGRTFAQGFAGLTEQQYVAFVDNQYGALAPAVLKRYPWSAYPAPYTGAYAVGAVLTDSGAIGGIGGCAGRSLAAQFATGTPTYFFQFDDRNAPGLNNNLPGYQWGAGHAMELAYLWPSFTNGFSLYAELTSAQLQLSRQMLDYWGSFVRSGTPNHADQPTWPRYDVHKLMSLRPGERSTAISDDAYAAQHQCGFWNTAGRNAEG